ncbi:hypothetical protein KEM52_002189, partial [Ascosphaera acerosa]
MSLPWDYIAKLVCIGDSGTGKSSLTIRLCEGRFSPTHDVTIGVECGSRVVPVGPPASKTLGVDLGDDGGDDLASGDAAAAESAPQQQQQQQKHMKLSLWDTAGQETYKSITRSYFRGASGALLVFDVTRPATFRSVTTWLQDLRQIADDDTVVILVGNKCDLLDPAAAPDGVVTRQEAERWCADNDVCRYVETSAKSGENVERAFLEVAERVYRNVHPHRPDQRIQQHAIPPALALRQAAQGAHAPRRALHAADVPVEPLDRAREDALLALQRGGERARRVLQLRGELQHRAGEGVLLRAVLREARLRYARQHWAIDPNASP